jgi:hypothetical protein
MARWLRDWTHLKPCSNPSYQASKQGQKPPKTAVRYGIGSSWAYRAASVKAAIITDVLSLLWLLCWCAIYTH